MSFGLQYEFLVCLLLAIVALELGARRLDLSPAATFIVGGIVLALVSGVSELTSDPNLLPLAFLPSLLMNRACFTVWREFQANFAGVLLLALGAVVFTTLAVGLTAKWLVPDLPWAVCFALGAIVSPPGAVAPGAILERLNRPGRRSSECTEPERSMTGYLGTWSMNWIFSRWSPKAMPDRPFIPLCRTVGSAWPSHPPGSGGTRLPTFPSHTQA